LAGATPPEELELAEVAELPEGLKPLCGDYAKCGAERPLREARAATKPLVETGGWGFSYGPLPLRHPGTFPNDDTTAEWMRGQWSWRGRDDLGVMKRMGANVVRLYGNDPRASSGEFLDEANRWGLKVVAGISDWPYTQAPDNCVHKKDKDCYESLRDYYGQVLGQPLQSGGFLVGDEGSYHPALDTLIIINEPDLKIRDGNHRVDQKYMKAVLSALDGILAAEVARGIDIKSKDNIKLTATWSYATCPDCPHLLALKDLGCCIRCEGDECLDYGDAGDLPVDGGMRCIEGRTDQRDCPGLPMVMDFHSAIEDPSSVGYTFKTQGWKEAFASRWVHSLNAFVSASAFNKQFLSNYMQLKRLANVEPLPVMLGEFGDPHLAKDPVALEVELKEMVEMVKSPDNKLFAINYFEFQVSYWKPCSEEDEKAWDQWHTWHWAEASTAPALPIGCSERNFGIFALGDIAVSKTGPVGKEGSEAYPIECIKPIFKGKPEAIAKAFGGSAPDTDVCEKGWGPESKKYCVASRSDEIQLYKAVVWVCDRMIQKDLDCEKGMPPACLDSDYSKADWIFSTYYETNKVPGEDNDHLCDFTGSGLLTALPPQPECVLAPDAGSEGGGGEEPEGGGEDGGGDENPDGTKPPAPSPRPGGVPHTYEVFFVVGAVLCVAVGGVGAAMLYNTQAPRAARRDPEADGVEMS